MKIHSENRAIIDNEEEIIEEQYNRAIKLLTKYKEKVKNLASELLQNEVIFKSDLEKFLVKEIEIL